MAPQLFLIFILSVHLGTATRTGLSLSLPGLTRNGSKGASPSFFLSLFFLGGIDMAKFCCFQYSHKILPWRWVNTYEFTRNSCSQQAVM